MCTTERMVHGVHHRSSQKAFGPSSDPRAFTRIFQNMSAWFKIGINKEINKNSRKK